VLTKSFHKQFKINKMTTKNFFTYQTILNFGFGLGLFFFPQMMMDTYGGQKVDVTGAFEIVARGYGTGLIGLGIAAFLMRNASASLARYAFLVASCATGVLVILVHIRALLNGDENSLGWLTVLLLGVIVAWSGVLISKEDRKVLA
jgi:hypothetical protein